MLSSRGLVRLATTVGARAGISSRRFALCTSTSTSFAWALCAAASSGRLFVIEPGHGPEAELGRGDGEHPRAGAEVGERSRGLTRLVESQEELEAHLRRGVGAGAERLARIDRDVDLRVGIGLGPRGPHAQPSHPDGLVKVAPAVSPVVGDLRRADLHQALARRGFQGRDRGQLSRRAVDRVLHVGGAALLLHASRRQLDQLGEHLLGHLGAAANRQPNHPVLGLLAPAAAQSRAPPGAAVDVEVGLVERALQRLGQLDLIGVEASGHHHAKHDVQVAAGTAPKTGKALALQRDVLAGLGAGSTP